VDTTPPAGAEMFRTAAHSTGVRGLDYNPLQSNLLASGAGEGEMFIWDMNQPTTPYSPGPTKSSKLVGADVTCVAWNRCVPHILASTSSNGVTVVWDLKNRREVFSLTAPGAAGGAPMAMSGSNAQTIAPNTPSIIVGPGAGGARRQGVVAAWHPDIPTQFVTALEDDNNPSIYLWDLRNAHAPLRMLSGHSKGILSIAWCPKDADLLLSCGKDNRTLCWNPGTGEFVGELPAASNWCFDVQWSSRNPDLLSVASFDGSVSISQCSYCLH
jgi:protein transport protein SEC31